VRGFNQFSCVCQITLDITHTAIHLHGPNA
jgi:hypothetical protein